MISTNGFYRSGDKTPKIILNGIYTENGTNFSYLALPGQEILTVTDEVKDV